MKKFNLFLTILAAAAGFTNCTKGDLVENKEAGNGGAVVYATTDAVTKTTLANDYSVLWSTGDQIKFIKSDAPATTYTFTLSSGSGTSNGTFTCGEAPVEGTYTVYYPATYDGTNWPAQTYVSATDISGAPMKATATVGSDGSVSDIAFANEGGILRYTVKGSKTIKSINVKSTSPTLDVTLDCGTSGVALTAEGTVFNIALPAGTYSDATLTLTAMYNIVATKAASSFIVTKNVVSLATFESSALSFIAPPAPDGFVDLGVTEDSGKPLYWAKCNLGATNVWDSGDYFAWGEAAPYYTTTGGWPATPAWNTGKDNGYAWQSYCGNSSFVEWSTPPYDATSKILKSDYDAATAANSSWRTPKSNEFQSLKDNCYWEWTEDYNGTGVKGVIVYKAKAAGDKGKYGGQTGYTISDTHIFLPAAGWGNNTWRSWLNGEGAYWSSSLFSGQNAYCLYFYSSKINPQYNEHMRYGGFSVRPVTTEGAACVAAGTMVTMGDGSQKAVEKLEVGDVIRTVDHETGEVSSAPVCFVWETLNAASAFTLTFEGGTDVTVIEEHGFYDREEQKYAFINADNAKDYIGHHFYNADNGQWLELKSSKMLNKRVDAYAIVTSKHLNHLSNGILSMCDGSIKVLANIFEYDSQLMFDADKKAANIAEYGLTSLEKVLEYKGFTEADYYNYNLQYLNVAIGKGLTTWDYVKALGDYCEANQIY